jgi:hypothetical protein
MTVTLKPPRAMSGLVGGTWTGKGCAASATTVMLVLPAMEAVLEDWLGVPAEAALGGTFARLPVFRS